MRYNLNSPPWTLLKYLLFLVSGHCTKNGLKNEKRFLFPAKDSVCLALADSSSFPLHVLHSVQIRQSKMATHAAEHGAVRPPQTVSQRYEQCCWMYIWTACLCWLSFQYVFEYLLTISVIFLCGHGGQWLLCSLMLFQMCSTFRKYHPARLFLPFMKHSNCQTTAPHPRSCIK